MTSPRPASETSVTLPCASFPIVAERESNVAPTSSALSRFPRPDWDRRAFFLAALARLSVRSREPIHPYGAIVFRGRLFRPARETPSASSDTSCHAKSSPFGSPSAPRTAIPPPRQRRGLVRPEVPFVRRVRRTSRIACASRALESPATRCATVTPRPGFFAHFRSRASFYRIPRDAAGSLVRASVPVSTRSFRRLRRGWSVSSTSAIHPIREHDPSDRSNPALLVGAGRPFGRAAFHCVRGRRRFRVRRRSRRPSDYAFALSVEATAP